MIAFPEQNQRFRCPGNEIIYFVMKNKHFQEIIHFLIEIQSFSRNHSFCSGNAIILKKIIHFIMEMQTFSRNR